MSPRLILMWHVHICVCIFCISCTNHAWETMALNQCVTISERLKVDGFEFMRSVSTEILGRFLLECVSRAHTCMHVHTHACTCTHYIYMHTSAMTSTEFACRNLARPVMHTYSPSAYCPSLNTSCVDVCVYEHSIFSCVPVCLRAYLLFKIDCHARALSLSLSVSAHQYISLSPSLSLSLCFCLSIHLPPSLPLSLSVPLFACKSLSLSLSLSLWMADTNLTFDSSLKFRVQ